MSEEVNHPLSTDEVLRSLRDRDSDRALSFNDLALEAQKARRDGDVFAARAIMERLEQDLRHRAESRGWSEDYVSERLDKYNQIVQGDNQSEKDDKVESQGLAIAERQLKNGLISPSQVDVVARSHAERIRHEENNSKDAYEGVTEPPYESSEDDAYEGVTEPPYESSEDDAYEGVTEPDYEVSAENITSSEAETSSDGMEKILESLNLARSAYAKETAKDRKKFWGRFLESDSNYFSRFIKRVPGANQLADFINDKFTHHDSMDNARMDYENALSEVLKSQSRLTREQVIADATARKVELESRKDDFDSEEDFNRAIAEIDNQMSEQSLRANDIMLGSSEDVKLQASILKYQRQISGKANKFTNWWARQNGFTGKLKKAGVVLATGAAVGASVAVGGIVAGIMIPAAVATVVGGASGAGIGLHLNSRLANSRTGKDKDAKTVAELRFDQDHAKYEQRLQKALENREPSDDSISGDDEKDIADVTKQIIIGNTESNTAEVVKANRNRLKSAIAIAALGGRLGAGAVELMNNALSSPEKVPGDLNRQYTDPGDIDQPNGQSGPELPTPDAGQSGASQPLDIPKSAYVEVGSGEIRETRQVLEQVLGRPVSMSDANQVYRQIGGGDIFTNDTNYFGSGGDVRISSAGEYTFKEGIVQKMVDAYNSINS